MKDAFKPREITIVFHGTFSDTKERFSETATGFLIDPTIVLEISDEELKFFEVGAVSNEDNEVVIDLDGDGNRFGINLAGKTKKIRINPLALARLTVPDLLKTIW